MKTTLILPAYNEEKAIAKVLDESLNKIDEIIVVDDGSSDRTYNIAKEYSNRYPFIKVLRHTRNQGKPAAIRTGVNNASGDIIILNDADFTFSASYIPQFISGIEKGADMVIGERATTGFKYLSKFNIVGNKILSFFARIISGRKLKDTQNGFRAFKRDMFMEFDIPGKGFEYEPKLTVRAAKLGYNIVEIPVESRRRIGTAKLNPVKDGFLIFLAILSVIFVSTASRKKRIR